MTKSNSTDREVKTLFASSIVITTLLFFLDEGFYNFNWVSDFGNWVAFAIYSTGLFIGQFLVYSFGFRKTVGHRKTALSILLGSGLALFILIGVVFNG